LCLNLKMVISPFPEFVSFSVKTGDTLGDFTLSPEEATVLSDRACKKRRDEFNLGRAACHSALKKAGFTYPPPVLKGSLNEPIWPNGFVGALTHAGLIAICAICPCSHAMGIGVDLEELEGVENQIPENAYDMIGTGSELGWVKADKALSEVRIKMLFSAKEAAFKAFSPHAMEYLDFKEAIFQWDDKKGFFSCRLLKQIGDVFPYGCQFEVGSLIVKAFVFSYILLPAMVG
jgi:4'-phosphopantetheinyl transferase EntD